MSIDGEWCRIRKFVGNQLRATSYKVKMKECYKVPSEFTPTYHSHLNIGNHIDNDDDPVEGPNIPLTLSEPLTSHNPKPQPPDIPILIGVEDEHDTVQHDSSSQSEIPPTEAIENPITQEQSRPKRASRPPKYLEDYVRY